MAPSAKESKTWMKVVTAFFILKTLKSGAAHGNKIAEEIKQLTAQTILPNPNFLYPILRDMEAANYVVGQWENPSTRGKRIYTITAAGGEYFYELQQKVKTKFIEVEHKLEIIRRHVFVD